MNSTEREALAKKRFGILNMVRMLGMVSALAAAANIGGKLLPNFTPWLGYALLLNAAADILLIPALLKKKWRQMDSDAG
jgi:hypothetical protein